MDRLDIGILRELMTDNSAQHISSEVRRPYLVFAKDLLVTEDTIRNRILRMRRSGLITGWRVGVNPTLLGYQTTFLLVDVSPPAAKGDVIAMVRNRPNAIMIMSFFGNSIGVSLAYTSPEGLEEEIKGIREASHTQNPVVLGSPIRSCKVKLSRMDWRIANSLRQDPRKPYRELADELKLSRRTVARRAERMISAGALLAFPELNLSRLHGGDLAGLHVYYRQEFRRAILRLIHERYGEFVLISNSAVQERGWFVFVVPNMSTAYQIQAWASNLRGARSADLRFIEEFIVLSGAAFEENPQDTTRSPTDR